MASLEIGSFFQNVREQITPDVQDFVGDIPQEVRTALESGIRGALMLARPLFGPNEVANDFPLFPEPVLNVNDATSESASVLIPDDVYLFSLGLLDIGGRFGPGSELFSQVVNLNFDRDADDNDAEQVLKEIVDGDGGATFDFERVPGIEGVKLLSITPDSYTLSFESGDALDVLTLKGPGIEAVVNKLDSPANLADGANNLSLIDLSEETVEAGSGAANPVRGIADARIDTEGELAGLINAALNPADERVSLLSIERDSFAVRVNNQATGASDLLIFGGSSAGNAVASAASNTIDPSNGVSEFTIADVTGNGVVATGSDLDLYFGGVGTVGSAVTEDELLGILSTADGRPGVGAVDQGDTVRLEILSANDTRDVIVFATDEPVPAGAFDSDLFA